MLQLMIYEFEINCLTWKMLGREKVLKALCCGIYGLTQFQLKAYREVGNGNLFERLYICVENWDKSLLWGEPISTIIVPINKMRLILRLIYFRVLTLVCATLRYTYFMAHIFTVKIMDFYGSLFSLPLFCPSRSRGFVLANWERFKMLL